MKLVVTIILLASTLIPPFTSYAQPVNQDSPFGVICPWEGVGDTGVGWIRVGASATTLDWGAIQKEEDKYDWKDADAEVNTWVVEKKLNLLPILGYTAKWASSGPNGEMSYPPKDLKYWSDFVYNIVSRYKDRVKYWEVWNEPNIEFWYGNIGQYSDLLKAAYVAAKKADPSCKVVFGGTAGVDLPYTELIYGNGCKYYFDVMAVHPYQWGDTFNDEWFSSLLTELHQYMVKQDDGHKEIWLTELGWSTSDAGITEQVQARLLVQCLITSLSLSDQNVTKAFWFSIKDWGGPGYGLLCEDGSRKPSFDAYRYVTRNLESAEYIRPMHHGELRCHLFRKGKNLILAAWMRDKSTGTLELPEGKWRSVCRIDGTEESIDGKSSIQVGPEPVFIIGTGDIKVPVRPKPSAPRDSYVKDVWCSVPVPSTTARLYVERGRLYTVNIMIHNDSSKPVTVDLNASIGVFSSKPGKIKIEPARTADESLKFNLPATFNHANPVIRIRGRADGKLITPIDMPVSITDGPRIDFFANSFAEKQYMNENNGSGASPSTRFNGNWTYKFDLPQATSTTLKLDVGAHMADEWRVSVSRDKIEWKTALSGKSNRSWHQVDVSGFIGGPLYVKFEGNNQQLRELILDMKH